MSERQRRNMELPALVQQIHESSFDGTYGALRIHIVLRLKSGALGGTQADGAADA